MLASDDNNPQFSGAFDPDARLSVTFYKKPVLNEFKSAQKDDAVFDDVDYVKIFIPGDDKTVIDTPAGSHHKQRFPKQWLHYLNTSGSDQVMGTPIRKWEKLTPAQLESLTFLKFFTVESIANASDSQIQSIGMLAGTSAYKFRQMARDFLQKPNASEESVDALKAKHEAEIKAIKEETDAKMAALLEQFQALSEKVEQKGKPGRPPKE